MTKRVIERGSVTPAVVVYGFFWNDVENNTADRNIHAEQDVVIHKPRLDLRTHTFTPADTSANDVTVRYAAPSASEAFLTLAAKSVFLRAAGRVAKYDLPALVRTAPAPQFDETGRRSLEGNLNQFKDYLRTCAIEFVILHVPGGPPEIEDQLAAYLRTYSGEHSLRYIRPVLEREHYLPTDPHLSESGARRVAAALQQLLK